jgi:hypothetical protein
VQSFEKAGDKRRVAEPFPEEQGIDEKKPENGEKNLDRFKLEMRHRVPGETGL